MISRRCHASGQSRSGLSLPAIARWLGAMLLGTIPAGPSLAQYMALTAPDAPAAHAINPVPSPPPRGVPTPGRADLVPNGALPNQRTGLAHPRVVRDICIGCDR